MFVIHISTILIVLEQREISDRALVQLKLLRGMEIQGYQLQGSTTDRLSNLDAAILDDILCRLPIKDAVRTSILSTEWRDKWVCIPRLVFDDRCYVRMGDGNVERYHFTEVVHRTLSNHCGKINVFKLYNFHCREVCDSDFDSWLDTVTRKGASLLQKLVLHCHNRGESIYKLPTCVFFCEQLTHLHMSNISLEIPANFVGFKHLICLKLKNFVISGTEDITDPDMMASLIRCCPVLETLDLLGFKMIGPCTIYAPKLKRFLLTGLFETILFESCPVLEVVFLYKLPGIAIPRDKVHQKELYCNLFENPNLAPCLNNFAITGFFLQYMSARYVPQTLASAGYQLKKLELNAISLRNRRETTSALTILKLFSNLEYLKISVRAFVYPLDSYPISEILSQTNCYFNKLKVARITVVLVFDQAPESFRRPILEFTKFLLARSPMLEKMIFKCDLRLEDLEMVFMRDVLSFHRASEHAEIQFSGTS